MSCFVGATESKSFDYEDDDFRVTGVEILNEINSMKCSYVVGVKEDVRTYQLLYENDYTKCYA